MQTDAPSLTGVCPVSDRSEAAFSNIVLANGGASAIGFFMFPNLTNGAMATTAFLSACVAILAYVCAEVLSRCKSTY